MAKQKRLDLILGAKDRATAVLGRVSGAIGGFVRRVGALAAPLAAVLSVAGVVRFGQRSVQAFFEQEQAVKNLETALINAGDAGAGSLPGLQAFASGIQAVTTQGDEATLALAAQIATLGGLTGGALADATKQTLGLARATGQGADMMGRAYLNALEGNFSMLERYVPALRATKDETEKMALVQQLAANGFKLMESDAGTARGQLQQMKNSVGDLMELVGARLAPMLGVVAGRVRKFAEDNGERIAGMVGLILQRGAAIGAGAMAIFGRVRSIAAAFVGWWADNILPLVLAYAGVVRQVVSTIVAMVSSAVSAVIGFVKSVIGPMDGVGNALVSMRNVVQVGLIAIEFGFKNWKKVIELAALSAGLAVVTFAGQVKHFFTEVIPTSVKWLADNWRDILTDMFNFTKTVMMNIVGNVVETFKSIPDLLSGEKSIGDIWGESLVKGFEAKLSTLPEIAARQQGALEQVLRSDVSFLTDELSDGFSGFLEQRLLEIEKQKNGFKNLLNFDFGGGSGPPAVDAGDLIKQGTLKLKVEEDGKSLERKAVGIASVDITRRFLGLGSGRENLDPAKQTAENTRSMIGLLQKMVEAVRDQADAAQYGTGGDDAVRAVRLEAGV